MTNRDRFTKVVDFLINILSVIIFIISLAVLFVIMFIQLPEDADWTDMINAPENYSLIVITIILNIQIKLIGSNLIKNKYQQSNEYIFAEKVDGKTTGDLLKNQNQFIQFNAERTLKNREASRFEYLSGHGYTSIEEVRQAIASIKPTKKEYRRNKKLDKWSKLTFETHDKYKLYKKAPKVLKGYNKVKYVSTIIKPSFWNYITQSSFKKGKRILNSYTPSSKFGTIIQTIIFSFTTAILAFQTFKFGYDPEKLPIFISMLGTLAINFFMSIITNLIKLKEIPAYVKNKFRELSAFKASLKLPEPDYLEVAAKELADQLIAEQKATKDRARLKKEAKAAKMTEDTKLALAKEANKKAELDIKRLEALNKKEELAQIRRENKVINNALKIKKE